MGRTLFADAEMTVVGYGKEKLETIGTPERRSEREELFEGLA